MEAALAPAQLDFRAELHQLIDQIQDEAVLRVALLLSRFVVAKGTEAIGNSAS